MMLLDPAAPAEERLATLHALPDEALVPLGYLRDLLRGPEDQTEEAEDELTMRMWERIGTENLWNTRTPLPLNSGRADR